MTTAPFKPKGPFPLWLADFEKDTFGWSYEGKFLYLRLLDHLWSQGGYIPDDDDYLVEAMGIHKCKGYRKKLALIRSKLSTKRDSKGVSNGIALGIGQDEEKPLLFQKRVLKELEKARKRSELGRHAANTRWQSKDADGIGSDDVSALPPTPTLKENKQQLEAEQADCYRAARGLFPNHGPDRDPGGLVNKLLAVMTAPDVLAAIERAKSADDPWPYLWGVWRKRQYEADKRAKRATADHPADEHIWGKGVA